VINAETTESASESDAHLRQPGARTKRSRRTKRLWFVGAALAVAIAATACLPPGAGNAADHNGTIAMINSKRAANGLGALAGNGQLDYIAQNWAQHLAAAGQISHQDLYGLITSPYMGGWMRLTENLFEGGAGSTNADVVNAWMASSGHAANILDPNVNSVGVGVARDGAGNTYVVADFGLR
jgi:uncharacterized protein YkwD